MASLPSYTVCWVLTWMWNSLSWQRAWTLWVRRISTNETVMSVPRQGCPIRTRFLQVQSCSEFSLNAHEVLATGWNWHIVLWLEPVAKQKLRRDDKR